MREILDSELEPASGHVPNPSAAEVRGLMELEFETAQREKLPASLLRVHVEGLQRLAPTPERRRVVLSAVVAGLRALPREGDLFASRDGDDLVVLLPRTLPDSAEAIARLSIENARKLMLPGAVLPQRTSLCIGVAHVQSDLDLYFETLLQVAEEGLAVASGSGGETFIHTQLYGLFQRQIERVRGPRAPQAATPSKTGSVAPAKPSSPSTHAAAPAVPSVLHAPHVSPAPHAANVPHVNGLAARLSSFTESAPAIADAEEVFEQVFTGGEPMNGMLADPVFEARIKSAFAAEARSSESTKDVEARVLELARAWAQDALVQALRKERQRHKSELDLYERRIQKLTEALNDTEEELRRIGELKNVDPGVASAYRGVQGLAKTESLYAMKLSLLAKVLQANLELRAKLGGVSPAT